MALQQKKEHEQLGKSKAQNAAESTYKHRYTMIEYHFEFEEKPDGSFRIDYKSPSTETSTDKEVTFAKLFIGHIDEILKAMARSSGGTYDKGGTSKN